MLLSLRAVVEFGLLLVVGSLLLFTQSPGLRDPRQRDLLIARLSLGLIVVGLLILSLSPTVAPAILGEPPSFCIFALATNMHLEEHKEGERQTELAQRLWLVRPCDPPLPLTRDTRRL